MTSSKKTEIKRVTPTLTFVGVRTRQNVHICSHKGHSQSTLACIHILFSAQSPLIATESQTGVTASVMNTMTRTGLKCLVAGTPVT